MLTYLQCQFCMRYSLMYYVTNGYQNETCRVNVCKCNHHGEKRDLQPGMEGMSQQEYFEYVDSLRDCQLCSMTSYSVPEANVTL